MYKTNSWLPKSDLDHVAALDIEEGNGLCL
jgi:hypothetical protein